MAVFSEAERVEVKKVARDLLDTLNREKLVIDWRQKQKSRSSSLGQSYHPAWQESSRVFVTMNNTTTERNGLTAKRLDAIEDR